MSGRPWTVGARRATLTAPMRRLVLALSLACDPAAARAVPTPVPAPSAAPAVAASVAPAPAPARTREGFQVLAGVEYVEVITGGAAPSAELPLVIALHGLGDRPDNFSALLSDLAAPARVVLPRAHDPVDEDGFSWFPIRARSADVAGLSRGIADAGDRLVPFIRELVATRPTRGKPVVTGFSQGGMLSFYLAVRHPELFAAAVPVGGWLPPPLWPSKAPPGAPPIVALHGEADAAVKFGPTKEAVDHLRQLGFDVTLRAWPEVGHAIPPAIRRELHARITRAIAP